MSNFKWKIFLKFCGLLRISELYEAVISRQAVGSLFWKVLMHLSYPQTHERFILTELENLNFGE